MKLKELQALLQQVNKSAILVSPRVLDRGLQEHFHLPAYRIWDLPHRSTLVVDRRKLVSFIEPDDLELSPDTILPDTDKVILLAKPNIDIDGGVDDDTILGVYWRRLFHAMIHVELDRQRDAGELTEAIIQNRIDRIGAIVWDEASKVLLEESWLTSAATQEERYVEFVAVFLEQRYFLPHLTSAYFPAIEDAHKIEQILTEDLNAQLLFATSRLPGAKDPTPLEDPGTDEANDFFNRLVHQANRDARHKNLVRAAILRVRASRVAPAELTVPTRANATLDLTQLVERLQKVLDFDPAKSMLWVRYLDKLLEKADQDRFPVESSLLFDFQNACQDHETEIYTFSLIDWAVSGGKRPVQRPLPSQRQVLILKHLRNALSRLTAARITQEDRDELNALIQDSLDHQETTLRERYRPVLKAHLEDAGFQPRNVPEEAACEKLVEEILDRFIETGFLSFGDVRDIVARNQMKMADLGSPQEFLRGDALVQLDKRLSIALDGVYRPGEVYLRGLERITALFFGTVLGRAVTLFALLPVTAGFLLVQAVIYLGHLFHLEDPSPAWNLALSSGASVVVFGLLHWPALGEFCRMIWRWFGRAAHVVFVEFPEEIRRSSVFRSLVESWAYQLFYWVLLTPLFSTLTLRLCFPAFFETWWHLLGVFFLSLVLVGTRAGRGVVGVLGHLVWRAVGVLREGLLQGLVKFLVDVFHQLVHLVESLFHVVDEWLRFRQGEGSLSVGLRMFLGLVWFPVSYVTRFYFLVLIEPGFNPLKMPISIVIAKLTLPILAPLTAPFAAFLAPVLGTPLATGFAAVTIFLLPDAATFLLWELSSNWQLYEANRPKELAPVVVGSHGETMRGLLQPGFHSGTIPTLYYKLRKTKRQLFHAQSWKLVRLYDRHLEEIARSVRQFVARNLLSLLRKNAHWKEVHISVEQVHLAVGSIRVVLRHPGHRDEPLVLEFALLDGWLVGGMARRGWFDHVKEEQLWPLNTALAALYKLAGVQLVRDKIQSVLGENRSFEITRDALVVYRDDTREQGYQYWWVGTEDPLVPRELETRRPIEVDPPERLLANQLIYERVPMLWQNFVKAWSEESGPRDHANVLPTGRRMVVGGHTELMERHLANDSTAAREKAVEG